MRAAEDRHLLFDVRVEVDGVPRTATDSLGRYAVTGLASGPHELRFEVFGRDTRTVTVLLPDSGDLEVDVELAARPVTLPPIEVSGRAAAAVSAGFAPDRGPEPGYYRDGAGWRDRQVASQADVQTAMLAVPGVESRGEAAVAVHVRGGLGSENLVLLDGIPLFGASHFTAAASAVNPDAVRRIDVHTGPPSARFGGRLGGVLELESAEFDSHAENVGGAVTPTDVRSVARGALGAAGAWLLGGRVTFRNLLNGGTRADPRNGFADLLAVASLPLAGGSVRVVSFRNVNQLAFEPRVDSSVDQGNDATDGSDTKPAAANSLEWRSHSDGAAWTRSLPSGAVLSAAAWRAGAGADVDWIESHVTRYLHSDFTEVGISTGLAQPSSRGVTRLGVEVTRPAAFYATAPMSSGRDTAGHLMLTGAVTLGAAFAEYDWQLAAGLQLRMGARITTDFRRSWSLEPRMAVGLQPDPATWLRIGLGRTRQAVQSLLNEENPLGAVVGFELPVIATAPKLPVATADQLDAALEHHIGSVRLTGDAYLRRWTGVLLPALSTPGPFVTDSAAVGQGSAVGLITGAAVERGRIGAQVSVALARVVRAAGAAAYHPGFERPWSGAAALVYRWGPRGVAQLGITATAGRATSLAAPGFEWQAYQPISGRGELAGTPTNLPGAVNGLRLPNYVRVDLGLRGAWPLGGPRRFLGVTLRAYNVLDRRNAVLLVAGSDGRAVPLRGVPRGLDAEFAWSF